MARETTATAVNECKTSTSCREKRPHPLPTVSVLGSVLLSIFVFFINDTDSGIKGTISEFVDDTKLCGGADTPEGWEK